MRIQCDTSVFNCVCFMCREYHPTALARSVSQSAILECKNLRYLNFPASIAVTFVQYVYYGIGV